MTPGAFEFPTQRASPGLSFAWQPTFAPSPTSWVPEMADLAEPTPATAPEGAGQDPYARYHQLRSETPVHLDAERGQVILTRYADVAVALKHPLLSTREVLAPAMKVPKILQPLTRPSAHIFARMMLFVDPPDHS